MSNPDSPALTLLHLSDLHFGQARGEGRVHFDQLKVVGELVKDARAMREKLGSPDAVLVTGDIAFSATPEQYLDADKWLRELATAVGVTADKVWLVPGNHDVDRTRATKPLSRKSTHTALRADPHGLNDYLDKDNAGELEAILWPKLEPYATFARAFGAPALSADSPFWRREITLPLGKLLLVGLNSCLLSLDGTDAKANLALSQAQLHRVLEPMPDHALTLALMHHPPEWLSDGEELLKELQKGPHLLFSGHIHAAGGGILHALGQGSRLRFDAGASHASPDDAGRHEYAWIRLSHDGLDWYPRVYSTKRNAFKADGDRLEDQQIHQRLEPGQLPKPLWEWLGRTEPSSPSPPPKPPLIPEAWRRGLLRRFEHLDLNADGTIVRPRLDELYVALKTNWYSDAERARFNESQGGWDGSDPEPGDYDFEAELGLEEPSNVVSFPVDRALSELLTHKELHFALQGGPGSGKSTFLRITALQNVRSKRCLPLLLQLKDFAAWLSDSGSKGESAELLVSWAGHELADFDLDVAELHSRLGRGETLWLLDGLDEIFDQTLRLRVAHSLDRFIHGKLGMRERLIVTSRPHALDDAQLQKTLGLQTTTARIVDLDQYGQRDLLQHWFRATYEPEVKHHAHTEARRMLEHLDAHAYLRDLRGNPLLLTTLANLYFSDRTLPERRAKLFELWVQKLLDRRFGPGAPDGSQVKVKRVLRALASVARRMMELRAVRELKDLAFRQLLEGAWRPMDPSASALETEMLALELGCHTGLLLMDGHPPVYRFSHLILQEYLAAWSIGQETSPCDVLQARLDEGAWRETILLTAGYLGMAGGEPLTTDFLEALLARRGEGPTLCRRLELAVQGAVEVSRDALSLKLKQTLQTLAVEALLDRQNLSPARERVDLGLALGRLGDPRLGLEKPENWIWIPPGEFTMGDDYGQSDEKPAHQVTLSRGFYMSRYPVTNHDFKAFMDDRSYSYRQWWSEEGWAFCKKEKLNTPAHWADTHFNAPNQPVVGVSWYEAEAFCRWLSEQPKWLPRMSAEAGVVVEIRLPTEAEWEYSARGIEGRKYPWGNQSPTKSRANYSETGLGKTSPVGAFPEGDTPEGLTDMAGNVLEWLQDWYGPYAQEPMSDPSGARNGSFRILRGGNWGSEQSVLMSDGSWSRKPRYFSPINRGGDKPTSRNNFVGFRIVYAPSRV